MVIHTGFFMDLRFCISNTALISAYQQGQVCFKKYQKTNHKSQIMSKIQKIKKLVGY